MTSRANLYIDQGTDFSVDIDIYADDGSIIDITNTSFSGDAKKVFSSAKVFSFSMDKIDPTQGKLEISLSANTSANIVPGKYQYDIVMTSGSNVKSKILEGLVFIVATMTDVG